MPVFDDIPHWSETVKPMWMRDALRRLTTQRELTDTDLEERTQLCKNAHGLSHNEVVALPLAADHLPRTEMLTEAFRRSVLKLFVDRELFEPEVADQMLEWMHSGFSARKSVWLDQDDAAAQARLARHCARCPVSLERLEYDAKSETVCYTSHKDEGPTAGRHTFEPTAFIARLVAHIPGQGQALQRYYGYYARRTPALRGSDA